MTDRSDPHWRQRAACRGRSDLFFPTHGGDFREARALCDSCPVKPDCRAEAVRLNVKWGIWGGLSRPQLRKLRQRGAA